MMKNLIGKFLAISSLGLLLLSSCKKSDSIVTVGSSTTGGTLTASTTSPVLTKSTLTATSVTFTASPTKYGYSAAVSYSLQLDAHSDNFGTASKIKEVVLSGLTQTFNVQDFNNILLGMKLATGVSTQVDVRVKSSLSATSGIVYSNVVSLTVTPFALTSWIYLVGQFNGYSTTAPDSLISPTGNGIYTGIINVTAGNTRFLVLPAKNYNNKYATITNPPGGTATTLTYATEYVTGGGNDLYTPSTPGYYLITLDINANTITIALTNTYSVIGYTAVDAAAMPPTNFSADVPLTKYVNDGVTGWTGIVALVPGSFKIRQNNEWTFSWGIPNAGSDGAGIANTLNDDANSNIPITVAGNYAVSFYTPPFAMGASAGASKPLTQLATYKVVKQ